MSTPLQSPRTVFILDVSESMRGLKSETLQLSTKRYIEDIPHNSYVGIVLFNEKAWIEHKVVKITDRKIRDSLIAKVPEKFSSSTDIGRGLLMALGSLYQENLNTESANFILVSDGEDTSGTDYVDQVLPTLLNAKVKIICIALGNTADPNLERLANETNGKVFIANDTNREMAVRVIESKANASKELNEATTISVCNDLIQINQTVEKKVTIDSDIGRNTNFTIGSEDINKFSVSIISPNGQLFDVTSSEFTANQSYKRYQLSLKNAESGVWLMHFNKHTKENLSATVSVTSQALNTNAIKMRVWLKDANSVSQMPPIIFAVIRKGNDDVMGAEVVATIDKPNETQTDVILNNYNSIYWNYFTDYCGSGRYNVSVLAKNNKNNCQLRSAENAESLSGVQYVPQFERQLIVGCFKITDFMPSASNSSQNLEKILLYELQLRIGQKEKNENSIEIRSRYYEKFRELGLIAFGSYGFVYKAMDKRDKKTFAIKKIPIVENLEEKYRKEVDILSKLKSNFIVGLEFVWIEDNYLKEDDFKDAKNTKINHELFEKNKTLLLHIQMELCSMTLREAIVILNQKLGQKSSEVMSPLGYYLSSELFIEVLEGINYLHKNDVIHRDLKPSNILVTDGKNGSFIKVADFGLATIHEFDGQSHTKYKGTFRYAAPEVMSSRSYDTKADIYSLGVIAQELFNIDMNKPIGKTSVLEKKYSAIFDVIVRMLSLLIASRPNCETILRERSSWAQSFHELSDVDKVEYKIRNQYENFKTCVLSSLLLGATSD